MIDAYNTPITRRLIACLIGTAWLNDEVSELKETEELCLIALCFQIINFSMCMLQRRDNELCLINSGRMSSHYFSSFFIDKLYGLEFRYDYECVERLSYYQHEMHLKSFLLIHILGGRNVLIFLRKIASSVR